MLKVSAAAGNIFKSLLLLLSFMAIKLPMASPAMMAASVPAKVRLAEPNKSEDSLSQAHSRTVITRAVVKRIREADLLGAVNSKEESSTALANWSSLWSFALPCDNQLKTAVGAMSTARVMRLPLRPKLGNIKKPVARAPANAPRLAAR